MRSGGGAGVRESFQPRRCLRIRELWRHLRESRRHRAWKSFKIIQSSRPLGAALVIPKLLKHITQLQTQATFKHLQEWRVHHIPLVGLVAVVSLGLKCRFRWDREAPVGLAAAAAPREKGTRSRPGSTCLVPGTWCQPGTAFFFLLLAL